MSSRPPEHVAALDGVRGLAVLMVLAHNLNLLDGDLGALARAISLAMDFGWVGVQLFFVLSGFLITGILLDTRRRPGYWRAFLGRRVLRIFPLYYTVLIGAFVVAPRITGRPTPGHEHQIWLWTYLANWAEPFGLGVPWFPHFWSLAIEEQFYLVWPLLVRALSPRALVRVCGGLTVVALISRIALRVAGYGSQGAYMFTICRFDALALGAVAAVVVRTPEPRAWVEARRGPLRAATLALLLITVILTRGAPRSGVWTQTFGYTAFAIVFTALVLDLALSAAAPDPLARAFAWTPLRVAGTYSYGIYVFHSPLHLGFGLPAVTRIVDGASVGLALALGYFVVATLITCVVAVISYHLLERPFLRLKRYFVVGA